MSRWRNQETGEFAGWGTILFVVGMASGIGLIWFAGAWMLILAANGKPKTTTKRKDHERSGERGVYLQPVAHNCIRLQSMKPLEKDDEI